MEQAQGVIGAGSGPQTAHKVMREGQHNWILVQNRDRTPAGILWEPDVAEAVRTGRTDLPWSPVHEMPTVSHDTSLADLFAVSAQHLNPLVVLDDDGRTVGVIPRVTLLAAAANNGQGADMPETWGSPDLPLHGDESTNDPTTTDSSHVMEGAN